MALPSSGRIAMSQVNTEFGQAAGRRTGMAEAGTWMGIGAGARHGFNSYHGKSNITLVGTMTLTCAGSGMTSSNQTFIPSTSTNTTVRGLKAAGYLRNTATGATYGNNTAVRVYTKASGGSSQTYGLQINGVDVVTWTAGSGGTTATVTLQIYN